MLGQVAAVRIGGGPLDCEVLTNTPVDFRREARLPGRCRPACELIEALLHRSVTPQRRGEVEHRRLLAAGEATPFDRQDLLPHVIIGGGAGRCRPPSVGEAVVELQGVSATREWYEVPAFQHRSPHFGHREVTRPQQQFTVGADPDRISMSEVCGFQEPGHVGDMVG